MKYYRAIKLTLALAGTRNWYQGIDKPNVWQWLYAWRLSFSTAWGVAKMIHL